MTGSIRPIWLLMIFLAAVLPAGTARVYGAEFRVVEKLTVKGGIAVSTSPTASPLLSISSVTGTGFVGIGTTSPDRNLVIRSNTDSILKLAGPGDGGTNIAGLYFYNTNGSSALSSVHAGIGGVKEGSNDAMGLKFMTTVVSDSPIERLRIDKDGNVGIGMVPIGGNGLLQVGGTINSRQLSAPNDTPVNVFVANIGDAPTLNTMSFVIRGNPSATGANRYVGLFAGDSVLHRPIVLQENGGNVGIGTTGPGAKLEVNGNVIANTPTASNHLATKGYVDAASGAEAAQTLSPNTGLYANTIAAMTPPYAYTEVCFKSGSTSYDVHTVSEATAGGNCSPGDTGFIMEKAGRGGWANLAWELAKEDCLQDGMRLPEVFEIKLACKNLTAWSITMTGGSEWASNHSYAHWTPGSSYNIVSPVFQYTASECRRISYGDIGHSSANENSYIYRCVR